MARTELARLVVLLLAGAGWLWPQSLRQPDLAGHPTASTVATSLAPRSEAALAGVHPNVPPFLGGALEQKQSRCIEAHRRSRCGFSPGKAARTLVTSSYNYSAYALASSRLFNFSQAALVSAASFDLTLTASGLRHPPILHLTVANNGLTRTVNFDESDRFAEGGWARILGAHNTPAILAAYIGEDLAIFLIVRHFVHRHPRWRALGTLALLSQSWVHIASGHTWIGLGPRLEAPYRQFNPVWVR